MRVLLVYPRFPKTFWSYEAVLALVGRKVFMPPLGLLTVAALLPQEWELTLVDRNVREATEEEWASADLVMLSAMIVQKDDFLAQIAEAKRRGKRVVVGGPYPTSVPEPAIAAGADDLVLDEGEITIPLFLASLDGDRETASASTRAPRVFRAGGEKPDLSTTPVPRFDLVDFDAYDMMAVQFSRGCPFLCEFCDIITLYGRRPRTKTPRQMLAELDRLLELGWNRGVFVVDDNFIGHKPEVKSFLRELEGWQARHGGPFAFNTEASIDLARDPELLRLMGACQFDAVFIGIETPDEASLALTRKHQNTRQPLADSIDTITAAGLRVMAGFIMGFDGEKTGAGDRIVRFIEQTAIPTNMLSLLQALPNTGLWTRLRREGRLRDGEANGNQTTLLNFVPTRPVEELASEYVEAFAQLYEPAAYLDRAHRYFLKLGAPRRPPRQLAQPRTAKETLSIVRALAVVVWRQGVLRPTRWKFWHHLFSIARRNRAVLEHYLAICAHNEHFLQYRAIVRREIALQLPPLAVATPIAGTKATAVG